VSLNPKYEIQVFVNKLDSSFPSFFIDCNVDITLILGIKEMSVITKGAL